MKSIEMLSQRITKIETSRNDTSISIYLPKDMELDEYISAHPELEGRHLIVFEDGDLDVL